jgi:hypothetical protein
MAAKAWVYLIRHKWLGTAIAAAIIIVALFILWSYLPKLDKESVSPVISMFAVLVTLSKGVYDVLDKEAEKRKKSEDKKEKILTKLNFGYARYERQDIVLSIYNDGSTPLDIREVRLSLPEPGSLSGTVSKMELADKSRSLTCCVIQPHTSVDFYSGPAYWDSIPRFEEHTWIEVHSFKGVLERIPGKAILELIPPPPDNDPDEFVITP